MALTGLVIVGFLFGHAAGNLQYFLGPDAYNTYAEFLQGLGEGLLAMRGFLIVCLVLHIISAVYLRLYNNAAKPTHYKVKKYVKSKLTARTMLWTGLLILTGLIFHLLHFTTGSISFNDGYNNYEIYSTGYYAVDVDDCDYDCYSACYDACDAVCPTDSKVCGDSKVCADPEQLLKCLTQDGFTCEVIVQDDGKRFAVYDNDTISIDDYMARMNIAWEDVKMEFVVLCHLMRKQAGNTSCVTAQHCCDDCPAGDEMCEKCKANPEQCSKFKGTQAGTKIVKTKNGCGSACEIPLFAKERRDLAKAFFALEPLEGSYHCFKYFPKKIRYKISENGEKLFISGTDRLVTYPAESLNMVVKERHDVHQMVTAEFSSIGVALIYLLFVILVGFHLNHAIQSAFHTLGIEGPKFTPIMRLASIGLAIILVLLFSALPMAAITYKLLTALGFDFCLMNCLVGGGCL